MTSPVTSVFIDANLMIRSGKPPGGPMIERLIELKKKGVIYVVTTDLTKLEVAKRHAANDYEIVKEIARPHFKRVLAELTQLKIPFDEKAEIFDALLDRYKGQVNSMYYKMGAHEYKIDDVKPLVIFDAYTRERLLFARDKKKNQFPDAFVFEKLRAEASKTHPIALVSDDDDFDGLCAGQVGLTHFKSIEALFEELDQREKDAPEIEDFLSYILKDVLKHFSGELADWGLLVADQEDGEIYDTDVLDVDFRDVRSYGQAYDGGDILIIGDASLRVLVAYTHPNWEDAIWDGEDRRLIPFEDVSGRGVIDVDVPFSMAIIVDEDNEPVAIDSIRFTNDDFQWVDLYPNDPEV